MFYPPAPLKSKIFELIPLKNDKEKLKLNKPNLIISGKVAVMCFPYKEFIKSQRDAAGMIGNRMS